jgi:hypothetical protein
MVLWQAVCCAELAAAVWTLKGKKRLLAAFPTFHGAARLLCIEEDVTVYTFPSSE